MNPLPIPDFVKSDPAVLDVREFHLPEGSGISGPPAGAFLVNTEAENALEPHPMWHMLLEVTDEDIEELKRSKVLVVAVSVVPVFQVHPWHLTIEGEDASS